MDDSSNNYSQQTLRGLIATYCNVALMLLSSRSLFPSTSCKKRTRTHRLTSKRTPMTEEG